MRGIGAARLLRLSRLLGPRYRDAKYGVVRQPARTTATAMEQRRLDDVVT